MDAKDWTRAEVTLSVNGAPLKLQITVPAIRVKPQIMLPTFQHLANAFTDLGVRSVEKEGLKISCQKGCGACCRQPVPLSEVEIYYIALLVENLQEPRKTEVKRRFEKAAVHFRTNGWFEKFENCMEEVELKKLIREYFAEGVACPFLEEESCSIHALRPIACREYLVTTPKENCSNPNDENVTQVPLPVNVSRGVTRLALSGNLSEKKYLPMVFALEWEEQYPENFPERTGEEWLADFFGS